MTPEIINKIGAELKKGITTEIQVVYVLTQIRKLIKMHNLTSKYERLCFHCDWVLHPHLNRNKEVKNVIDILDIAHLELINHNEVSTTTRNKLNKIIKFESFKEELLKCLEDFNLPKITEQNPDGWIRFLHLYSKVVQDCPLTIESSKRTDCTIREVTLKEETANKNPNNQRYFKIIWEVRDSSNAPAFHEVINSYDIKRLAKPL